jgi:hypothetical protein
MRYSDCVDCHGTGERMESIQDSDGKEVRMLVICECQE